jgi:CHAT domain-containing protein/tetratricopeptide (TPR) repeat protein
MNLSDQELESALQKLIDASTWEDIKTVLAQHPELVSDDVLEMLKNEIEVASQEGDREAVEILNDCYLLLDDFRLQFEKWESEHEGIPIVFEPMVKKAQAAEAHYTKSGKLQVLETAITAWESILNHKDFPNACLEFRVGILNNSGNSYLHRYWASSTSKDLEQALLCYENVVKQALPNSSDLPMYLNNLGIVLNNRYDLSGNFEDLQQAVEIWQQAVQKTGSNSSELPKYLNNLGKGFQEMYNQIGAINDLQQAIDAQEKAVKYADSDSPELPGYLTNLGNSLLEHYAYFGKFDVLQRAIDILEKSVQKTDKNSPELLAHLNNLGNGLSSYYAYTGDLKNLDKAIAVYQQAVDKAALDNPDLPTYLKNLGAALNDRYIHTSKIEDLHQAIYELERTVQISSPNSPDLPIYLNSLGSVLKSRYDQTGVLKDLERAIGMWSQAKQKSCRQSPDYAMYCNNLGIGFNTLYDYTGSHEDLEKAITAYDQAAKNTPLDSIDLPACINNLGSGLSRRYSLTGKLEDLQQAIEAFQKVIQKTPQSSKDLNNYFNNLANVFQIRYTRTGSLDDLQQAIEAYSQAIENAPPETTDLPLYLINLGSSLGDRYIITGNMDDLQRSIAMCEEAVQCTSHNSPSLPGFLNTLSNVIHDRYNDSGVFEDLERAIALYEQALQKVDENAPVLPALLNNLGTGLSDRYLHTGELKDLEESVAMFEQAIQKTAKGSPDLPMYLNSLAFALHDRYARTQNPADFQQAITYYEQAAQQGIVVSVQEALRSVRNWFTWAFTRQSWQEIEQAHRYAQQASEQLFKIQLLRYDKEIWLRETQGLAVQAAYALAKNNKLQQAVVALESGLARLLSEALARDRADLEQLNIIGHTDLYDRYQQVVGKWHFLTQQPEINQDALRATRDELDATISAIQQIPSFEQFLKPPTFATIQQAAQDTTLVYILATEAGGLALLVREEIIPVWLPALTDTELHNLLNNEEKTGYLDIYFNRANNPEVWHNALDTTTEWLWRIIMAPIIDVLPPQAKMTLIPVGLLALLPLHAAWTADTSKPTGKRYVLDDLSITYAPNALALTKAKSIVDNISSETLLAIDEPQPVQADSLPNSQYEVKTIATQFENANILEHNAASRTAVLDSLPNNRTVLHFSCHGRAYLNEPLRSGLLMSHHEEMTLEDILNLRLQGVRLATLSACETGMIGTQLPDEFVNLSSGLLQAGCAGVVASLWSLSDNVSSMFLMIRLYELWRQEHLAPPEALRQAQIWVRDSSNAEKFAYLEQAIEDSELSQKAIKRFKKELGFTSKAERSFAHPYYWAAFTYTGA